MGNQRDAVYTGYLSDSTGVNGPETLSTLMRFRNTREAVVKQILSVC